MSSIYANGHKIDIRGDKLYINGKLVEVKLKRGLFGVGNSISSISNGRKSKIKIGRNSIVISPKGIEVNGKTVTFADEKPLSREDLEKSLNKNARKYLISLEKSDSIEINGTTYRRIIALQDIIDKRNVVLVKKGEKGGFIESRDNLSETGTCWIYDNAIVGQEARVMDDAKVSNNSSIFDDVKVRNNAQISGEPTICGNVTIGGKATVSDSVNMHGNVSIGGNTELSGNVSLHGNASVGGDAKISGNVSIHGNVSIGGNAELSGNASLHGNGAIGGNVKIGGNVNLHGDYSLSGDEVITKQSQVRDLEDNQVIIGGISIVNGRVVNTGVNNGIVIGDVITHHSKVKHDEENKEL